MANIMLKKSSNSFITTWHIARVNVHPGISIVFKLEFKHYFLMIIAFQKNILYFVVHYTSPKVCSSYCK